MVLLYLWCCNYSGYLLTYLRTAEHHRANPDWRSQKRSLRILRVQSLCPRVHGAEEYNNKGGWCVNTSVFEALSIGSGLVVALLLCIKRGYYLRNNPLINYYFIIENFKTLIIIHIISILPTTNMLNNDADAEASAEVVFEYTGEGCVVPKCVTIVRFHPSVVEVEDEAFKDCDHLSEVVLNEGLQKISWRAFYCCTSLSSIILPSTITEIGNYAFDRCGNLREVEFNDGLKKIGFGAFWNCTSLSSITLPSTVTEICNCAFHSCSILREVVLNEGLQKIGRFAFHSCKSLSSITLPSTVTEIENGAFYDCINLRKSVWHGVPREIGQNAFCNCASLGRFTFPTISTRLDNLIQVGHWSEIENEVDEVRGAVERSDGELFVLSTQSLREGGNNWNTAREDLDKISRLISCYELKEGTSILELALWKFKLDQVDKANPIPRKKCRMDVPGPVKDIILQYLPYECLQPVSDIPSSSSGDDDESSDGDYYESSDDDYD